MSADLSETSSSPALLLVGGGKMGSALLKGWEKLGLTNIAVVDPAAQPDDLKTIDGLRWLDAADKIDATFKPDAVILAVKPQSMAAVLPAYARFKNSLFLSIAAGQTLHRLSTLLGSAPCAIVRAMPNLPASVGQGISGAVANPHVTPTQRTLADRLLHAAGDVVWLEQEALLDPLTALSGSGPAYLFALVETMAGAGEKLGLPPALALQLARQTVIGSAALLAQSPQPAAALRQAVTSPGGTTEAALNHLLGEDGLPALMLRALRAASARAKLLAE